MENNFDERYEDVAGTSDDIIIGGGEMAISLAAIRKEVAKMAGGVVIVDDITATSYRLGMADGKLYVEEV